MDEIENKWMDGWYDTSKFNSKALHDPNPQKRARLGSFAAANGM